MFRFITLALVLTTGAAAQETPKRQTNIDEAKVGRYTLPDVLQRADGRRVTSAADWPTRRAELLKLFAEHQYGKTPTTAIAPTIQMVEAQGTGLGGLARRTQVRLVVGTGASATRIRVVLYTPTSARGPVPVLLHLGFSPNLLVFAEPGIDEGQAWNVRTRTHIPDRAAMLLAGFDARSFIQRGFGVAHVYYGDIEPDFDGGEAFGVRAAINQMRGARDPDHWGAIGAWAWGLSRVADWLQANPAVNGSKIALSGASRLGKAVLWAAAQDQRFALVMPLISGEGGAALSRRNYGETIADLTNPARYPYWFAPRYANYAADPSRLPVDAHMLLALIAPRPMLLVNGSTDTWSDPRGELLAAEAAKPVYRLFGKQHLLQTATHDGGHTVLRSDLVAMAEFMQRSFGKPDAVAAPTAPLRDPGRPSAWTVQASQQAALRFAGDGARHMADHLASWQDLQSDGWPLMNTKREAGLGFGVIRCSSSKVETRCRGAHA